MVVVVEQLQVMMQVVEFLWRDTKRLGGGGGWPFGIKGNAGQMNYDDKYLQTIPVFTAIHMINKLAM